MQVELAIKKEPEATGSAASAQAATQIHAWTGDDDDDDAVQFVEKINTTIENGDQVEVDGIVVTGHTEDAGTQNAHTRSDCNTHGFANPAPGVDTAPNANSCSGCWCYVCDKKVMDCNTWLAHCNAVPTDPKWVAARQASKKASKQASKPSNVDIFDDPTKVAALIPALGAAGVGGAGGSSQQHQIKEEGGESYEQIYHHYISKQAYWPAERTNLVPDLIAAAGGKHISTATIEAWIAKHKWQYTVAEVQRKINYLKRKASELLPASAKRRRFAVDDATLRAAVLEQASQCGDAGTAFPKSFCSAFITKNELECTWRTAQRNLNKKLDEIIGEQEHAEPSAAAETGSTESLPPLPPRLMKKEKQRHSVAIDDATLRAAVLEQASQCGDAGTAFPKSFCSAFITKNELECTWRTAQRNLNKKLDEIIGEQEHAEPSAAAETGSTESLPPLPPRLMKKEKQRHSVAIDDATLRAAVLEQASQCGDAGTAFPKSFCSAFITKNELECTWQTAQTNLNKKLDEIIGEQEHAEPSAAAETGSTVPIPPRLVKKPKRKRKVKAGVDAVDDAADDEAVRAQDIALKAARSAALKPGLSAEEVAHEKEKILTLLALKTQLDAARRAAAAAAGAGAAAAAAARNAPPSIEAYAQAAALVQAEPVQFSPAAAAAVAANEARERAEALRLAASAAQPGTEPVQF
eukprot:gene16177-34731_t